MFSTYIVLDVDGTLIKSEGKASNRLHKRAFAHAMKVVFAVETDIDKHKVK